MLCFEIVEGSFEGGGGGVVGWREGAGVMSMSRAVAGGCRTVDGAAVVGESGLFAVVWESTELGEEGALRLLVVSGCKANESGATVGKDGRMGGGFVDARGGDFSLAGGAK